MPLIPTGYGQVTLPFVHSGLGRAAVITWGFQNVAPGIGPFVIAGDIWGVVASDILPVIDSEVTLGPLHVEVNIGGTELVGDGNDSNVGGSPDSRPPAQVAVVVKKDTGVRGRKNRGRFFLPWAVTDASVDELGRISGGTVSDFQDKMDDLLADLTTAGYPMVVLHNTVGTPTPVIGLIVRSVVGTQRRRLDRSTT